MHAGIAVPFEVGGGENVPAIPEACANRNFSISGKRPMEPVVDYSSDW